MQQRQTTPSGGADPAGMAHFQPPAEAASGETSEFADAELVQLWLRVIALEKRVGTLLAETSAFQLDRAWYPPLQPVL